MVIINGFCSKEILERTKAINIPNDKIGKTCERCLQDTAVVFDPNGTAIDTEVAEYQDAVELSLPEISGTEQWTFDGIVDAYSRKYGVEELAQLLVVLSPENNGIGLGYQIIKQSHWLERYDIDYEKKEIYIDDDEYFSDLTNNEAAEALHDAVMDIAKHIAYENEGFWGAAWRVTKGTGITVLGGLEVAVGVIGIITPEPGTTAAGAVVATYGVSTMGEGISMMFGANNGEGYNLLEEGFASVGELSGGDTGEELARTAFLFTNLVVSIGGSYKILKVPNTEFLMKGTYKGAKYYEQGFTVGRLQLLYPFGRSSGKTLINISNNSNQWFFRINQIEGKILMNGRLIGVKNWHRVESPIEMLKILVKLALQ